MAGGRPKGDRRNFLRSSPTCGIHVNCPLCAGAVHLPWYCVTELLWRHGRGKRCVSSARTWNRT